MSGSEFLSEVDSNPRIRFSCWVERGLHTCEFQHRILLVAKSLLQELIERHAIGEYVAGISDQSVLVGEPSDSVSIEPNLDETDEEWSLEQAVYLAPELTGALNVVIGPPSDLYSLGVLLFRGLSGRFPLSANNLSELLLAQMTTKVSSLRRAGVRVPSCLDEFIVRLLERDPRDRYQSARAALDDLVEIVKVVAGQQSGVWIGQSDHRERLAEPAFVGREEWIEQFENKLNDRNHRSGWILLSEAGYGKTRLLHEFAKEAAGSQAIVLEAKGTASENSRPLEVLESLMSCLQSECESHSDLVNYLRTELKFHHESLHRFLPSIFHEPAGDIASGPDAFAGRRLLRSFETLLDSLNQYPKKTVVLVDDFDLADELSREILAGWIQKHASDSRGSLLVIATKRTENTRPSFEEPHSTEAVLTETLPPLGAQEISTILSTMIGVFPTEAIRGAAEASAGNISLGISFLHGLIESKRIVFRDGIWSIKGTGPLELESLSCSTQSIKKHIESLSDNAIAFLTASTILGKNFRVHDAQMLSELTQSSAIEIVEESVQRQLLWVDQNYVFAGFIHEETRLSLLSRLTDVSKKNWHLEAAKLIENDSENRSYELAFHFDAAQCQAEAVHFAKLAASQSQRQFAHDSALRYYGIAQRWIHESDLPQRREIAERIGDIHLSTGDYDSAEKALLESLSLAQLDEDRMRITSRLGEVEFKRGRMRHAADYYVESLNLLGVELPRSFIPMIWGLMLQVTYQTKHSIVGIAGKKDIASPMERLRWTLLSRLAHTYWFSRGPFWTLFAHLRGMNDAERFQDTPELAKSYSEHAPVCSLLGFFKRAESYSQKSLKIRKDQNDVWGTGQTLSYASVVQLAATKFETCVELASQAIELLEKTGDAWETNMARYQRACALYRLGRFRECMTEAQRLHESGVEIGDDQASGISLDLWIRCAPHHVPAEIVLHQAKVHRTDAQSYAQTQIALGLLQLRDGQTELAEASLREAIARCKQAGHLNTYISPSYVWLATILRHLATETPRIQTKQYRTRLKHLRKAVNESLRIARKFPADLPHALRESALTHALYGKTDRAARDLRRSIEVAVSLRSPMQEWESLVCLDRLARENDHNDVKMNTAECLRLEQLATQCADSIRRLEFVDARQETLSLADRFDTLMEDGRRIARSLHRDDIFHQTCLAAQHLLRAQVVAICGASTVDSEWKMLECVSSDTDSKRRLTAKLDDSSNEIVNSSTCQVFAWEHRERFQSGSLLSTPIRARDTVIAHLLVGHTEIEGLFGSVEMQVAEFVSTLAGAALENAEGFEELQRLNSTLEQRVAERTAAAELRASELDISNAALRNTEEQLREAIEVVEAANQAKSRFLATMSHEIRTPLNGILGMTQLAIANSPDNKQLSFLQTIQRSGEALLGLLNDVLDFSKIEAGKMTIESIAFCPREVLQDVIDLMAIPAWQKGIELAFYFSPEIPSQILGDPMRLRQVVLNLLGNAIKFTPRGYVEVRAEPDAMDSKYWRIRVIDTGIGISKEKQQAIFDAFSQADNTTTRQFGGTGLGLSISTELVRLMDGKIEVQSQPNVGSEFFVTLPLLVDDTNELCKSVRDRRLLGKNILIVDACRGSRSCLELMLTDLGANSVALESWSRLDAVDQPAIDLFDAAIVAEDEAEQFKSRSKGSKIPVWVLHGPTTSIPSDGRSLVKPLLSKTLSDELSELHSPETQTSAGKNTVQTQSSESSNSGPSSSRQLLRILVAEDGLINQCVLVGLLELGGHTTMIANNGLEAVELAQQEPFDLCLMDLDMPDLDGIGATMEIRAMGITIPIYSMTAHHDQQHEDMCFAAGMNGFLTKPINPSDLQMVLDSIAIRRQSTPVPIT